MSSEKNHYESGAIHNDYHKEINIGSVSERALGDIIKTFFKENADEAVIVGEDKKVKKPKEKAVLKPEKHRETMTFKRKNCVLEGHLSLLFDKLNKAGWIEGDEGNFKTLFSGKLDENCQLTWTGEYGKGTLVELFKQMIATTLIIVPDGFTLSSILEGHFVDADCKRLTGLDKGNSANAKALPFIYECVKLLRLNPNDGYDDDEDFQQEYDPYDHQDMNLHKR